MFVLVLALGVWTAFSGVSVEQSPRERAAALAATAEDQAAGGRLADAIRTMEAAERLAPAWAELKVNLAALRSQAGDYAGAIAAARAALGIDPSLDGARFNLGLAQLKSGDASGAIETLEQYATSREAPPVALAALGLALFRVDRASEAADVLQRAVQSGVRDPDVLLTLGDAEDARHDWGAAEAAYRAALAAHPNLLRGHYSLGLMLFKQRRYDEAAAEFDRELARDPRYAPALRYRAELELDRGNVEVALPLLLHLTSTAPQDADGWRILGRARLDHGQADEAVRSLERARVLAPNDAAVHFLLGRALAATGRKAEADAAFARANQLNQQLRDELQKRVSGKKRGGVSPRLD